MRDSAYRADFDQLGVLLEPGEKVATLPEIGGRDGGAGHAKLAPSESGELGEDYHYEPQRKETGARASNPANDRLGWSG